MRILLTGPGGFLGSALACYWAGRGHALTLLARPSSRLERLEGLLDGTAVRVLRATTPGEVAAAVREAAPEAIVHTACSYGRKGENALDVMSTNLVLGTALLQAVLDGTSREGTPVSVLNTGTVLAPEVSLYALSKTQFSAWGAALAASSPQRLRFIDLRLQQMYGPGDDRSKFTTHVIEACRRNEPRLALTPGEQRRDFIHIDDVVRAYDRILERREDFAASDAIDVGSGEAVTMRAFVELAKAVTGASTSLDFGAVPYRANEAMLCVAETARLRGLGWSHKVSLADGLARMGAASDPER
ncbi:NAD-dependent epimerase/dehydratase family protein [Roseateles sp. BYS96W]|uniref:NAD-dependent epimerase/dehydratase family protein n=1 Tax=Pelomonas nitida TaxID=3299027 RepID=A0ABW7G4S1_9BURK